MVILLVDDEIPAIQGIIGIVNWKRLSIENVLTAYSMEEAIQVFESNSVDLLLTDIEMDNGTGLDLIEYVNQNHKGCINMILSSYPDFSYAQKAIELGAFSYLIKPIDDHDLENAIFKATKEVYRNSNKDLEAVNIESTEDSLVIKVKQYIFQNIKHEMSRDEIADNISLNPEYLSKYFKKRVGLSLSDYINKERISMAKSLLIHTNLPMSVIAENCGYNTLSYFSYVFKQLTGLSPSQYRKDYS